MCPFSPFPSTHLLLPLSSWLIFSLKWHLQSPFLLLHSSAIDLQEAKGIDEEDPRPTSFTWSYIKEEVHITTWFKKRPHMQVTHLYQFNDDHEDQNISFTRLVGYSKVGYWSVFKWLVFTRKISVGKTLIYHTIWEGEQLVENIIWQEIHTNLDQ